MSYKVVQKDPLNGNKRYKLMLKSAKSRNIKVTLTYNNYRKIIKGKCFYCGTSLSTENGYSIDRFDNNKEYSIDNSLGCCWDCNRSKGTKSHLEYYRWMNRLLNHQKKLHEIELKMRKNGKICKTPKDLMDLVNREG